jgi:hypothetical protein
VRLLEWAGCAGPPCSQPRWYSLPWHWWPCPTLARRRSRSFPCPPFVFTRGLVACACGVHAPWWRNRRNIQPAGCTVRRLARLLCAQQMVVTVRACVRRSCGALTRQQHASLILACRVIPAQSPAVRTMSSLFSEPAISLGIRFACARVYAAACKSRAGMTFCSVLKD